MQNDTQNDTQNVIQNDIQNGTKNDMQNIIQNVMQELLLKPQDDVHEIFTYTQMISGVIVRISIMLVAFFKNSFFFLNVMNRREASSMNQARQESWIVWMRSSLSGDCFVMGRVRAMTARVDSIVIIVVHIANNCKNKIAC